MTPIEKAREIIESHDIYDTTEIGIKDAEEMLMAMHDWAKQQIIEMACEWWEKEFDIMNMQYHDSRDFYQNKLDNFKKVMEEL